MKFSYMDESGTGDEPYAVMVGIIVDARRMHVTKTDWHDLLCILSDMVGREVSEIHTRDFYPGNSPWRELSGDIRASIITAIFEWLRNRKHRVVYSAVDKAVFFRDFSNEAYAPVIETLWRFMALHICLSIQKHHQTLERNKGHTVLIFDNEDREAKNFTELVRDPPEWTDTYYRRKRRQVRLDQIIDVPYFGDSRYVGLIQVADFVSFFLRRHIEIQEGVIPPRYDDEQMLVENWIRIALDQAIPKSRMYPSRGRCECADLFHRYAPCCIC